jgi:hypothetical protein
VQGQGLRYSDRELGQLVEIGMEGKVGSERGKVADLCPDDTPPHVTWQINGRPGRPPKTFVGVELTSSGSKPVRGYLLIVGPNDPSLKSELVRAAVILTSKVFVKRFGSPGDGYQPPRTQG